VNVVLQQPLDALRPHVLHCLVERCIAISGKSRDLSAAASEELGDMKMTEGHTCVNGLEAVMHFWSTNVQSAIEKGFASIQLSPLGGKCQTSVPIHLQ